MSVLNAGVSDVLCSDVLMFNAGAGTLPSHFFIRNQCVMILLLVCMTSMTYILTSHQEVLTWILVGQHLPGKLCALIVYLFHSA